MDITDNGTFYGQQLPPGAKVVIELGGTVETGNIEFGFKDAEDQFLNFQLPGTTTNATITSSGMFGPVFVPSSGHVGVRIGSASAVTAYLKVIPVRDELPRG